MKAYVLEMVLDFLKENSDIAEYAHLLMMIPNEKKRVEATVQKLQSKWKKDG